MGWTADDIPSLEGRVAEQHLVHVRTNDVSKPTGVQDALKVCAGRAPARQKA